MTGNVTAVVGLQYGDEGKGKIVDYLAAKSDAVIRANGGANAGHTVVLESGKSLGLHQIPSGITLQNAINIIGSGSFLDPVALSNEMRDARSKGVAISPNNLKISSAAHLVLPKHKQKDAEREDGKNRQGSTKAGISYVASDKALREGLRAEVIANKSELELANMADEEFAKSAKELEPYITDSIQLIYDLIKNDKNILLEGAQAFGLDINHGKYPFVTSSDTTVSGLLSGSGINYKQLKNVVGVAKATPSKVGGGFLVTKIRDSEVAENTRGVKGKVDSEYGTTTGRPREVGYLDLVALKKAVQINGVDEIALTKFDCLIRHGNATKVAVAYKVNGSEITYPPSSNNELSKCMPIYKELPTWNNIESTEAKNYLELIEDYLEIPVSMIGTGPKREDLVFRKAK